MIHPTDKFRTGTDELSWVTVDHDIPAGDVLAWTGGKAVVGTMLVERRADGTEFQSFMDVLGNEVLPWPSHWMRLPRPPKVPVKSNSHKSAGFGSLYS